MPKRVSCFVLRNWDEEAWNIAEISAEVGRDEADPERAEDNDYYLFISNG